MSVRRNERLCQSHDKGVVYRPKQHDEHVSRMGKGKRARCFCVGVSYIVMTGGAQPRIEEFPNSRWEVLLFLTSYQSNAPRTTSRAFDELSMVAATPAFAGNHVRRGRYAQGIIGSIPGNFQSLDDHHEVDSRARNNLTTEVGRRRCRSKQVPG